MRNILKTSLLYFDIYSNLYNCASFFTMQKICESDAKTILHENKNVSQMLKVAINLESLIWITFNTFIVRKIYQEFPKIHEARFRISQKSGHVKHYINSYMHACLYTHACPYIDVCSYIHACSYMHACPYMHACCKCRWTR